MLAGQGAEQGELALCARGREAWCEDGLHEPVVALVEGLAVGDGGEGVLERCIGAFVAVVVLVDVFTIHAHAADEGALAGGVSKGGEEVGGGDVDGGVVRCCRGAVAEEGGDAAGVDTMGGGEGDKGGFEGESVSPEP